VAFTYTSKTLNLLNSENEKYSELNFCRLILYYKLSFNELEYFKKLSHDQSFSSKGENKLKNLRQADLLSPGNF